MYRCVIIWWILIYGYEYIYIHKTAESIPSGFLVSDSYYASFTISVKLDQFSTL